MYSLLPSWGRVLNASGRARCQHRRVHPQVSPPLSHIHTYTHTPSISHFCSPTTPAWISLFLEKSYVPHMTAFLPPCDNCFIFGLFFIVQITMVSYSHLHSLWFLINGLWRIQSRLCYCGTYLFGNFLHLIWAQSGCSWTFFTWNRVKYW